MKAGDPHHQMYGQQDSGVSEMRRELSFWFTTFFLAGIAGLAGGALMGVRLGHCSGAAMGSLTMFVIGLRVVSRIRSGFF